MLDPRFCIAYSLVIHAEVALEHLHEMEKEVENHACQSSRSTASLPGEAFFFVTATM